MEEFLKDLEIKQHYNSEIMIAKRNNFEKMSSFIKAGLYYSEKFKEMQNQSIWQKYFASDLLKVHGNQRFKNMDYESARQYYEQALSIFRFVRNKRYNWKTEGIFDEDLDYFDENGKSDKEKKIVKGLKVILYQNICLVYLKLSKNTIFFVNDAFQACNEAIKLDQKSSKAYYLRAKSRLHKVSLNNEDFKLSIKDYKKALELDPENPNIMDELQKCVTAFDKIKSQDFHSSQIKQNCRDERISAEPIHSQFNNNNNNNNCINNNQNIQNKDKINKEYNDDNNKRKQPQQQQQKQQQQQQQQQQSQQQFQQQQQQQQQSQNKRDDQNRGGNQEIWNKFRIEKNYSEINYDLSYEVIQKTVI